MSDLNTAVASFKTQFERAIEEAPSIYGPEFVPTPEFFAMQAVLWMQQSVTIHDFITHSMGFTPPARNRA